jgi:predicted kinase
MLFIFGGLPGTGKTELSTHLAREIGAVHLHIDTIEQALREGGVAAMGPKGYLVAYKLAEDNLRLGLSVVADSVNPLDVTRAAWRDVAARAEVAFREIEVICSDAEEHRRRVETRPARIPGLSLPTWDDVLQREYHVWRQEHLTIDTAGQTPQESKRALEAMLAIELTE